MVPKIPTHKVVVEGYNSGLVDTYGNLLSIHGDGSSGGNCNGISEGAFEEGCNYALRGSNGNSWGIAWGENCGVAAGYSVGKTTTNKALKGL